MTRGTVDRAVDAAGVGLLAVLATAMLWWPQGGDQALFQLGGAQLARGGVYWRDFWDVKQPGIFWLYAASERAGAGVLGVRLLEIASVLVSGAVVARLAGCWRVGPVTRLLAPLLVLGPYALTGGVNGVGQVEGLVTLPLLVQYAGLRSAWTTPDRHAAGRWAALAGVAAATVGTFKVLYLPLAVVIAVGTWWEARTAGHLRQRVGVVAAAWLAASTAVTAAVVVYFAVHRALPLAWYSTVQAPREQLATGLYSTSAALAMLRSLFLAVAATGLLAAVAVWTAVSRGRATRETVLLGWLLTAAVLAAPQLPTTYRVLILLPPIGLLAVLGLDAFVAGLTRRSQVLRAVAVAALVVAALLPAPRIVRLVTALTTSPPGGAPFSDPARLAVGDRIGGSPMVAAASVMHSTIPAGTAIYVLGDPVVYRVLGARQAIEMNGWGPEIMSPRMWAEILRELRRSRPEWVFVESGYQRDIDRAPGLLPFLHQTYTAVPRPGGVWWHTTRIGTLAPTADGNQVAALRDLARTGPAELDGLPPPARGTSLSAAGARRTASSGSAMSCPAMSSGPPPIMASICRPPVEANR